MSNHILMSRAKITSPEWADGVGLLAEGVSAEVDDDFRPIAIDVRKLLGPSPLLQGAALQLAAGGLAVAVTSTAPDGRVLEGVVRSVAWSAGRVESREFSLEESCRLIFEPASD